MIVDDTPLILQMPPAPNVAQPWAGSATDRAQVATSNETLNAFLGTRRPAWMSNAQTPATAPGQSAGQTGPQPVRRRVRPPKQHPSKPAQVPATADQHSQSGPSRPSSLLPSPAPTNEPSPPGNTAAYLGSNAPVAGQAPSLGFTSPQVSPRPQTATSQGRTQSAFSSILLPEQTVAQSIPDMGRNLAISRPSSAGLRRKSSGVDYSVSPSGYGHALHQEKRARVAMAGKASTPGSVGSVELVMDGWLHDLDNQIRKYGGTLGLGLPVVQARYETLRDACKRRDPFYVVLHRQLCFWTIDKASVHASLPLLPWMIDSNFNMLLGMLGTNAGVSEEHLIWLSQFPGPFAEIAESFQPQLDLPSQITMFMQQFHQNWTRIVNNARRRGYPMLAFEVGRILKCPSPVLHQVFFRVSRRKFMPHEHGPVPIALDEAFMRDQVIEGKLERENASEDDFKASRAATVQKYKALLAQAQGPTAQQVASPVTAQPMAQPVIQSIPPNMRIPTNGGTLSQVHSHPGSPPGAQPSPHQWGGHVPGVHTSSSHARAAQGVHQGAVLGGNNDQIPAVPGQGHTQRSVSGSPIVQGPRFTPNWPALQPLKTQAMNTHAMSSPAMSSPAMSTQATPRGYPAFMSPSAHGSPPQESRWAYAQPSPTASSQVAQTPNMAGWATSQSASGQIQSPLQFQQPAFLRQPAFVGAGGGHPVSQAQESRVTIQPSQTRQNGTPPMAANGGFSPLNTSQASSRRSSQQPAAPPAQRAISRIPQADFPTSADDWTSVAPSLHLVQLRSPKRVSKYATSSRHYQFVTKFPVLPTAFPPQTGIRTLGFEVSPAEKAGLSKTSTLNGFAVNQYFTGSVRYRVRMCARKRQHGANMTESQWSTLPSSWPEHINITLNSQPLFTRRKQHFHHDLPIELTDLVVIGQNVVAVSFPEVPANNRPNMEYFMAVELVRTMSHDIIKDMITRETHISAIATRQEVARRLKPTDTDDIVVENDCLSVRVADPFSSTLFEVPVRGLDCKHLECFDLETWLQTRPRKPKGDEEPSLVDGWRCPICSSDARPVSLRIDEFFVEVRQRLLVEGRGGTKMINIRPDGTWMPVEEADDSEDDTPVMSRSRPSVRTSRQASQVAVPEMIELSD